MRTFAKVGAVMVCAVAVSAGGLAVAVAGMRAIGQLRFRIVLVERGATHRGRSALEARTGSSRRGAVPQVAVSRRIAATIARTRKLALAMPVATRSHEHAGGSVVAASLDTSAGSDATDEADDDSADTSTTTDTGADDSSDASDSSDTAADHSSDTAADDSSDSGADDSSDTADDSSDTADDSGADSADASDSTDDSSGSDGSEEETLVNTSGWWPQDYSNTGNDTSDDSGDQG